jgi:Ni/Co efflux regulator RcnB
MKRISFTLAFFALMATACNSNNEKDHGHDHGTHPHEDGSVHDDHDAHDEVENKQEEFEVDEHKKDHEEGRAHQH